MAAIWPQEVYYKLATNDLPQRSVRMDSGRKLALVIAVVVIVILVSLSVLFYCRTYLNGGADGHCWGNPIGLTVSQSGNQTTGDAIWKVTAVSVRSECISNHLGDLVVEVSNPNGTVIEHDTIQNLVTGGSAIIIYDDVTPPASSIDVADYFEILISAVPDGSHFSLLEKDSGSLLNQITLH